MSLLKVGVAAAHVSSSNTITATAAGSFINSSMLVTVRCIDRTTDDIRLWTNDRLSGEHLAKRISQVKVGGGGPTLIEVDNPVVDSAEIKNFSVVGKDCHFRCCRRARTANQNVI